MLAQNAEELRATVEALADYRTDLRNAATTQSETLFDGLYDAVGRLSDALDESVQVEFRQASTLFRAARDVARTDSTTLSLAQRLELAAIAQRAAVWGSAAARREAEGAGSSVDGDTWHKRALAFKEAEANAALLETDLHRMAGKLEDARRTVSNALELDAPRTRPFTLAKLAEVTIESGDLTAGLGVLNQLDDEPLDYRDHDQLRYRLPTLRSRLYSELGLTAEALRWAVVGEEIAKELRQSDPSSGLRKELRRVDLVAVDARLSVGAWGDARRTIASALEDSDLYASVPEWRAQLRLRDAVALIHLEHTRPELRGEAVEILNGVLAESELPAIRRATLLRLADLALRDGSPSEAADHLAALPELRDVGWDERLRAEAIAIRCALALGNTAMAVEPLLDRWERTATEFREHWDSQPVLETGIGFLRRDARREFLVQLSRARMAVRGNELGAIAALDELLRFQTLATRARALKLDVPTLAEIRSELLAPRRGLLLFVPGTTESLVIAVDSEGVTAAFAEGEDVATEELRAWRRLLLAPLATGKADLGAERTSARRVARGMLPAPIRDRLTQWDEIFVVGTDLWTPGVPFGALPIDETEYACLRFAIAHLPSVPLGIHLARRARTREGDATSADLWLLASPQPGLRARERWPQQATLEIDAEELARVTSPFKTERVETFSGSEATKEPVASEALAQVRILQFITHGVLDYRRPLPFHLLLSPVDEADDGLLGHAHVRAGRAPRAVILTACQSASAPARMGDEDLAGMTAAWIDAGADVVLRSPEDLRLEPVLRFSEHFHTDLVRGESPAAALRSSAEALSEHATTSQPCHFALLEVVGLGFDPLFPSADGERSIWTRVLAAALLGLAAAGALLKLKQRANESG